MSITDAIQFGALIGLFLGAIAYGKRDALWKKNHAERTRNVETHTLRFADPEAIADDMEQVADSIEARMANRQSLPRPGTGPNARVFRPKIQRKYPRKDWRG